MQNLTIITASFIDFSSFKVTSFPDALLLGGSILLIGVMAISIIFSLIWFGRFLYRRLFNKNVEKKNVSVTELPQEEIVETKEETDEEIVAVISAAVAMAEDEDYDGNFRVVSFRRV